MVSKIIAELNKSKTKIKALADTIIMDTMSIAYSAEALEWDIEDKIILIARNLKAIRDESLSLKGLVEKIEKEN